MKGEEYGLGRHVLPRTIALPIVRVAEMYVDRLSFLSPHHSKSWISSY